MARLSRKARLGVSKFREDLIRRDVAGKFADKPGAGDDAPGKRRQRTPEQAEARRVRRSERRAERRSATTTAPTRSPAAPTSAAIPDRLGLSDTVSPRGKRIKEKDPTAYKKLAEDALGGRAMTRDEKAVLGTYSGTNSDYREINATLRRGDAGLEDYLSERASVRLSYDLSQNDQPTYQRLSAEATAQLKREMPGVRDVTDTNESYTRYTDILNRAVLEHKLASDPDFVKRMVPEVRARVDREVADLDALVAKGSLPEDLNLYRGQMPGSGVEDVPVGGVFHQPSYSSTSVSRSWAESFGTNLIEIRARAGQKALVTGNATEREVVLPRDARLRVVDRREEGGRIITTAEVDDGPPPPVAPSVPDIPRVPVNESRMQDAGVTDTSKIRVLDPSSKRWSDGETVGDYVARLGGDRITALRRLAREHKAGRIGFEAADVPPPPPTRVVEPPPVALRPALAEETERFARGLSDSQLDHAIRTNATMGTEESSALAALYRAEKARRVVSAPTEKAQLPFGVSKTKLPGATADYLDYSRPSKAQMDALSGMTTPSVSPPESQAITRYTFGLYGEVHNQLRRGVTLGNKPELNEIRADGTFERMTGRALQERDKITKELSPTLTTGGVIANLDAAMARSSLPANMMLNRGVSRETAAKFAAMRPGDSFTDPSFSSSSVAYDRALNFTEAGPDGTGAMMRIRTPAGTRALIPGSRGEQSVNEAEVILDRNSRFVLEEVQGGHYIFRVEQDG